MEAQAPAEFESNPGIVSLGRKSPHLISRSAFTWVFSHCSGGLSISGTFLNSILYSILDSILEILIHQDFEYSPHFALFFSLAHLWYKYSYNKCLRKCTIKYKTIMKLLFPNLIIIFIYILLVIFMCVGFVSFSTSYISIVNALFIEDFLLNIIT